MKKFLSVLLALTVAFTFTFGSTMSAFAWTADKSSYTADEQKALLAAAYNAAIADAAAYTVDYDNETYGATAANDITTFTVSKDAVIAGLDAAYAAKIVTITGTATNLYVSLDGDYNATNPTASADLIKVKNALLEDAKTITNAEGNSVVTAAAWNDYKAALTAIVNGVDISTYTTTKNEAGIVAKNGKTYYTAKEAAQADIDYAKALIAKAKIATSASATPTDLADYNVDSYVGLYNIVFGDTAIIKIKQNKDDTINTSLVTSLTYSLVGNYATEKSEAADAANLAVVQSQAKAALIAAITTWENSANYDKKQDEQIAAYKEAKTYLIDNGTMTGITPSFDTTYSITSASASAVNGTDYANIVAKAAAAKKYIADLKAQKVAEGYNWDEKLAGEALATQLAAIYGGAPNTALVETGLATSDVTAGEKAAEKLDYSTVEAEAIAHGMGYVWNAKAYYEAEWTAVKAAIDTFNAAVDAAKVQKDINDAKDAMNKTIAKIVVASDVYATISGTNISTLETYAGLAYTNAHAADATVTAIYVTFDSTDKVTTNDLTDENVYLWYIAQGARTVKEATALYADACKVIDAYKTLATLKSEAAAVVSQIAALPAAPTAADKEAVIAAYDAYDALYADGKNYVTNKVTLDAAVKAVEKAEAYAVAEAIKALTPVAKVTAADKAAVKAAKEAYEAYAATDAYASKTLSAAGYDFATATANIQKAELAAITDAYNALKNKYVADQLTADDEAAVKALEDAIAAYIAEYNASPDTAIENTTAKISGVVANAVAAVKAAEEAQAAKIAETKAALKIAKVTTKNVKTKKIKVTGYKNAKAEYYQVQYKKSTAKSWKYATKKTTSTSKTIKVTKKGTYKVRVRACVKMDDGTIVKGAWKTVTRKVTK